MEEEAEWMRRREEEGRIGRVDVDREEEGVNEKGKGVNGEGETKYRENGGR